MYKEYVKGQEEDPVSVCKSGWEEPVARLGVLVHILTPSMQEAQAGSLCISGKPGHSEFQQPMLHRESLPQKPTKQNKEPTTKCNMSFSTHFNARTSPQSLPAGWAREASLTWRLPWLPMPSVPSYFHQ